MEGISAGDVVVQITGDTKGLDRAMQNSQRNVESATQKMQNSLRRTGIAFTALGVAGLKVVDSARKMNAQLGVTALNLGVSAEEMRGLALETTNVTFPLNEVLDTFDLLARAGVEETEVLKAVATAFDTLGDAIGVPAGVVTQNLIPAMKTFNLTAEEMATKMDPLTYLFRNTTVTLDGFNRMIGYVTPELVEMGLTTEDMIAILAELENQGYSGEVMTRHFRKAVTLATKEQIPLNEALGISTETIEEYKVKLEGATGITQEYADVANEQYGIMDKVKQKFSELTLVAGTFLTPLEPILVAMTALGPAMMFLSTATGTAAVKTMLHTAAMAAHTIAALASTIAIKAITIAQWLWNAALTANPLGLLIIGIISLGVLILVLRARLGSFTAVFAAMSDFILEKWTAVVGFFTGIPDKIKEAFTQVRDFIVAPFLAAADIFANIINFFIRTLNKLRFTVPSWVPGIGGKTFGFKLKEVTLPSFAYKLGEAAEAMAAIQETKARGEIARLTGLAGYQKGGIIDEPTLLYGLRSQRPYAVAGEAGREIVSPAGASIVNNFSIAQLIVREEADVEKVAVQLKSLQDRADRRAGVRG